MLAQFSQLLDIPWFIKCEGSVVEPPRSRKLFTRQPVVDYGCQQGVISLIADRQRPNDRQRHTNDRRLACQITSLEQAQEIYERYHAQGVIAGAAAARIANWLARQ